MTRASSVPAHSSYASAQPVRANEDPEVRVIVSHLSALAIARDQGVQGTELKRMRTPLTDAKLSDKKIAEWTVRVMRTGGTSRDGLERDIRNELNQIKAATALTFDN